MTDNRTWFKRGVDVLIAERGATQAEVAERLGMSPQNFARRIHAERPTIEFTERLCAVLGVELPDFLLRFRKVA